MGVKMSCATEYAAIISPIVSASAPKRSAQKGSIGRASANPAISMNTVSAMSGRTRRADVLALSTVKL